MGDPFDDRFEVDVAGGPLQVARAGPPPAQAECVALAIHGVTASMMTWRTLARKLSAYPHVTLLAPDLRGRGRSAALPGPYGIEAHVRDLIRVLDHVGVQRAVVVGHSIGAYVAARLAADHPERATGLVLLDAGLPVDAPADPDAMVECAVQNVIIRLTIRFPNAESYVAGWRSHPAFSTAWNEDVDAYAHYDLIEDGNGVRCIAAPKAVRTDSEEMVRNQVSRTALDRVQMQDRIHVLRAERGLLDDEERPLIPHAQLEAFVATHPRVHVEEVPGVNHYTLVMGDSPGPDRVAAAIAAACYAPGD